jgi:non-ribosomal peptide synthetase component F
VGQNAIEAYANQDIPFEMVVEKLSPSRRFNSSPLFQVMFQIVQASSFTWPDVRVEVLKVPRTTSKFDITLFIREAGGAFLCEWNYATDLFTRETINDAAYQFTALLDAVAVSPDVSLEYLVKRISQRSSATALSQV